ncbi:hypothetical protein WOLCODRAFT_135345 [Wolfiporia cocos MD-104 SS10]|uniref:BZIP domain-containing protein n=1 Tax=Wolfiporia cocos (strain MD-104) TaxID=742152 RepID=A0A2H3IV06_WOLCO|nr:hypothetical protein WOLCODRAFT_135345 [Wolfiporia cocos MD-104 SS10]
MSATTVAPSTTALWATASKEWVIPAKPKPGRKPKKDTAPAVQDEVDAKGRRVQNRAAQRAFRERKQSQLAELQARVQQFEQGEVERNVALQNIAKRLKEENEKLKIENAALKEKLGQLEESFDSRKRTRGESVQRSSSATSSQFARKRSKTTSDSPGTISFPPAPPLYDASSPSSSGSSPRSFGSSHSSISPSPTIVTHNDSSMGNHLSSIFELSGETKSAFFEGGPLSCGFCNTTSSCVCKDVAMQVSDQLSLTDPLPQSMENVKQNPPMPQLNLQHSSSNVQRSILDNLPEYQAPVPLRRRSPFSSARPVFPVNPPKGITATCTGDPSNCLACADDAFGKAFCDAIGKSVASTSGCGYCPDSSQLTADSAPAGSCCGNPVSCGGGCAPPPASLSSGNAPSMMMQQDVASTSETVTCDDAWRQLKSHPNVAFADLTLLAEVVARRSKCTGPRVEIYPAPGAVTPERGLSPSMSGSAPRSETNEQSASAPDPRTQYDGRQGLGMTPPSPPPQLVPQEVLISCGRQRVREVMADGVQDALRLLDAKFPLSGRLQNYCS